MATDKMITQILLDTSEKIDQGQLGVATEQLTGFVKEHPELVDDRFQAEMQILMKQMEGKRALHEFEELRALSLSYQYCELHYKDVLDTFLSSAGREPKEMPKKDCVWFCWFQGLEHAPEIVKCCYKSLQKLGKEIIVLDEKNLKDYVVLPDHIMDKYQKGSMGMAHYSDLIRLELLTSYGGTWIDATTWISGREHIASVLEEEDLFLFRAGHVSKYMIFDNWFIHAGRYSKILDCVKMLLYAYWEKEEAAVHYFIFHLFMTMACKYFPEEYGRIPLFSNEPCHVLQYELMEEFREGRWKQILKMSDVHKLTYTGDNSQAGKGTFLAHLLADEN